MVQKQEEKMCISPEEFNALIKMVEDFSAKQEETNKDIKEVKTAVKIMQPAVENTQKLVTGNGRPEEGLSTRLIILEGRTTKLEALEDKKDKRRWDIVQPVIMWIVLAFITFIAAGGLELVK